MKVWIDQDLCTGDGLCEEIAPAVFEARDDCLWVVKEDEKYFGQRTVFDGQEGTEGHGPDGVRGLARVPEALDEDVIEAAERCPGDCIFIEL